MWFFLSQHNYSKTNLFLFSHFSSIVYFSQVDIEWNWYQGTNIDFSGKKKNQINWPPYLNLDLSDKTFTHNILHNYYDFLCVCPGKCFSVSSELDIISLCNFNIVFIFLADGLFILLFSCIGKIRLFYTKFLIRRNFNICIYMTLQNRPHNMFWTIANYIFIQETSMTFPFWIIINILINFLNYIVTRKVTIVTRKNILAFVEK